MTRIAVLNRSFFVIFLLALVSSIPGCDPKQESTETPPEETRKPSDVPLRVWVVAPTGDMELVRKLWLSESDQPIEFTVHSEQSFLKLNACQADVVLYPARLLSELVGRDWIVKLPSSLEEEVSLERGASVVRAQSTLGKSTLALPLGTTVPQVIANQSLAEGLTDEPIDWDVLLERLGQADTVGNEEPVADASVDLDALVDRYLTIAGTISEGNPRFGVLFELQNMRARIDGTAFQQAASILKKLHDQPSGAAGVLGSHAASWDWLASCGESPAVIVASGNQVIGSAGDGLDGAVLKISQLGEIEGWNTGGGLQAAVAAQCRQSGAAVSFLRWLQDSKNRNALAPLISGIDANVPTGGPNELVWRAHQVKSALLNSPGVPQEPSLPAAHQYRAALATALLAILREDQPIDEQLKKAADEWNAITDAVGLKQRAAYEQSLGLTL